MASGGAFPEAGDYDAKGTAAILCRVRELLREGKIVAVKGLGGFLLACDAENDEAVRALRTRKRRSDKPFALMSRDIAAVESFCEDRAGGAQLAAQPEAADCGPSAARAFVDCG